jgi:hypothetical protein
MFARVPGADWTSTRGTRIARIKAVERCEIVLATPCALARLRCSHRAKVDLVLAKIFTLGISVEKIVKILLWKLHARVGPVEAGGAGTFATRLTLVGLAQLA